MTVATHRLAVWLRTPAGILVLGVLILFMNGLLTVGSRATALVRR